jgi:hypothetical protein
MLRERFKSPQNEKEEVIEDVESGFVVFQQVVRVSRGE